LVKDYNKKLEELEFAADKLAQNERESAWREMAKQVAHEIKNPLTPMKLSVQQLLRVYDPENPASAQKLEKVVNSLIEQIDVLTNIANEFSNFAKMPRPNEEQVDLLALINRVIELFRHDDNVDIELNTDLQEVIIMADKDQILRVFNNLIKNAIQAAAEERHSNISIHIVRTEKNYLIRIRDNGTGISPEQRAKLFVPYFTTKNAGSGLGLALCRQIIESHRGTIELESTSDQGTEFIITLPGIHS
jgi:nitrogen fixation/metabolism regulation signal transduction histidine kinase